MTKGNSNQVKQYILNLIDKNDKNFIRKTVETFGVSKSSVYNYVKQMCDDNVLKKLDHPGRFYKIVDITHEFQYNNDGTLGEDKIFRWDIQPLLQGLKKNAFSIWQYTFTEMMNNAIEHSGASKITVSVSVNSLKTKICIADNGIGIFKNIQTFLKKEKNVDLPPEDCLSLLFAGKFTTMKSCHSGEGIFFTSHLMDEFCIFSDNMVFSRTNFADETMEYNTDVPGTSVVMELSNQTKKISKDVFDRFSDIDEGFIRTHIPIAHMFPYGNPISRSEARRLGALISEFREITLDFAGVEEVGQAFCHELFVVWQGNNSNSLLHTINECENVHFMIQRVKNTK